MIIFIVFVVIVLVGYMWLIKKSIDSKFRIYDPDCVTCNGWPVIMVSYTWGYFGDWFPKETLCITHRIQGQHIARLESEVLDKPLPI